MRRSFHPAWAVGIFAMLTIGLIKTQPQSAPLPGPIETIDPALSAKATLDAFKAIRLEAESVLGKKMVPLVLPTEDITNGVTMTIDRLKNAAERLKKDTSSQSERLEVLRNNTLALNPDLLPFCEQIDFYEITGHIASRRKRNLLQNAPGYNAKFKDYEKAVERLFGRYLTVSELRAIGDKEFAAVMTELNVLEQDIITQGLADSLDAYAELPQFFVTDADALEDLMNTRIRETQDLLQPAFYPYDIPEATAIVSKRPHPYRAVGSYDARHNRMKAYWYDGPYDLKFLDMLIIHEVYPGHHLQVKTQPLDPLCPGVTFRTRSFVEGWATYAEQIAVNYGVTDAPEQKLGWLDYRLIRAMRILLDTALKTGEISGDDEARVMWEARMPARMHSVFDREIKRLKQGKRQHYTYILGSHAIMEARRVLESELGEDFDEKAFHHVLLTSRIARLDNLTDRVRAGMRIVKPYAPPSPLSNAGN